MVFCAITKTDEGNREEADVPNRAITFRDVIKSNSHKQGPRFELNYFNILPSR